MSDSFKSLVFQGDATVTEINGQKIILLTKLDKDGNPQKNRVGRVLQRESYPSDFKGFETTFVFRITKPKNNVQHGHGLAFFLANTDTQIPPYSDGMNLGIFGSASKVVAVEFDTHQDPTIEDPNDHHIGLDINSIKSVSTYDNWTWQDGMNNKATIKYDTTRKKMTVSVDGARTVTFDDVDLKNNLPENVVVGLSASTGDETQITEILDWPPIQIINN